MPELTAWDQRYLAMSWALGQLEKITERQVEMLAQLDQRAQDALGEDAGEAYILAHATTSELSALREASMRARSWSSEK